MARIGATASSLMRDPQPSNPAGGSSTEAERLSTHLLARTLDLLLVVFALYSVAIAFGAGSAPTAFGWTLPAAFLLFLRHARFHETPLGAPRGTPRCRGLGMIAMDVARSGSNTVAVGAFVVLILIGGLIVGPLAAIGLAAATAALLAAVLLHIVPAAGPSAVPSDRVRLVNYVAQLTLAAAIVSWRSIQIRRLLRDLRGSEARRTLLLEESPDAIASTDASGIINFQNRAAEQILGYPASEVVGRALRRVPRGDGGRLRAAAQPRGHASRRWVGPRAGALYGAPQRKDGPRRGKVRRAARRGARGRHDDDSARRDRAPAGRGGAGIAPGSNLSPPNAWRR